MALFKHSLAIALSITSLSVVSHEQAMEKGWCASGTISILGHFSLNKPLLEKFKGEENAVCSQLRSCGQFDDDDYTISTRAATSLCHSFSEAELEYRTTDDHLTVRAIIHSPVTAKHSEVSHHELYSIEQGIEFSCGICRVEIEQRSSDAGTAQRNR